ncbi:MAG: aldehyde ferredoxin oxidoreductase N-terminal domain-containing protein [Desulfobacterales bacterium]
MRSYGYSGNVLRVDLTQGVTHSEPTDPDLIDRYLGGAGFGARYLYDENPDGVHWADPENRLIIANGPLSNTPFHGSGTLCFVSKGPMTHLAVSTQANGFGGARLKSCGYDAMVIKGCADAWSYLYIGNDTVEIRDGSHLLGKDTLETQEILRTEVDPTGSAGDVSVFCIGPAGENRVRYSVIVGDGTHTASKGGLVLGVKAGVKPEVLFKALSQGSANSFALQNHFKKSVYKGKFERDVFPVEYIIKDINLALKTAENYQLPQKFGPLALKTYESAVAAGFGDLYYPVVVKVLEQIAGVEVRAELDT